MPLVMENWNSANGEMNMLGVARVTPGIIPAYTGIIFVFQKCSHLFQKDGGGLSKSNSGLTAQKLRAMLGTRGSFSRASEEIGASDGEDFNPPPNLRFSAIIRNSNREGCVCATRSAA